MDGGKGARRCLNANGFGEEFRFVFIDLFDRFLIGAILWVFLSAGNPGTESVHALFDGADIALLSVIIEAVPAGWRSDAHGGAQLLEDECFRFERINGIPERPVFHNGFQGGVDFKIRYGVLPLPAQLDGLQFLRFGMEDADALGESQMRMIERKPVAIAFGLSL